MIKHNTLIISKKINEFVRKKEKKEHKNDYKKKKKKKREVKSESLRK